MHANLHVGRLDEAAVAALVSAAGEHRPLRRGGAPLLAARRARVQAGLRRARVADSALHLHVPHSLQKHVDINQLT